ncbi:hypothetical protein ACO0QE_003149 [Hanseniaspora vineae]
MLGYNREAGSNCREISPNSSEGGSTKPNANPTTSSSEANFQSQTRSRPSCCVFVASLPAYLSDDALWVSVVDHFKNFGDVVMAKVLRDNKKRPYAFVQYHTEHEANAALLKANNSLLQNRRIRCEKARVNRTLLIGEKFPVPDSEKAVLSRVEQIGELEKMVEVKQYYAFKGLLNNYNLYQFSSNPCRSWYFQFAYRDDAISAHAIIRNEGVYTAEWADNIEVPDTLNMVQHLQKSLEEDKRLHPLNARNTKMNQQEHMDNKQSKNSNDGNEIDTFSIFIGQLPSDCTQEELEKKFGAHGEIESINLFTKQENNSFAFIQYKNEKSASFAIENENHSFFKSKTIHVQFRERNHVNAEKKRYLSYFQHNSFGMGLPNAAMHNKNSYTGYSNEPFDHKQHTAFSRQAQSNSFMENPNNSKAISNTRSNSAQQHKDRFSREVHYKGNKFERTGSHEKNFRVAGDKHREANVGYNSQQPTLPAYHLQTNFGNVNGPSYSTFAPAYYYNPNFVYYPDQGYSKEAQIKQDQVGHDEFTGLKLSNSEENPAHLPEKENSFYPQIAGSLPETSRTSKFDSTRNTFGGSGVQRLMPQPMPNPISVNHQSPQRNYRFEGRNHLQNSANPPIMLPFAGNPAPGMFPVVTQPPLPSQASPHAYGPSNDELHPDTAAAQNNTSEGNFYEHR